MPNKANHPQRDIQLPPNPNEHLQLNPPHPKATNPLQQPLTYPSSAKNATALNKDQTPVISKMQPTVQKANPQQLKTSIHITGITQQASGCVSGNTQASGQGCQGDEGD